MKLNVNKLKAYCCFLFILFPIAPIGGSNEITFHQLTVKEGLSQGWVRCIYQDKKGFLWFGAGDGLNKFDGYEFRIYKNSPGNQNSLINNNIKKIYEDSRGNLWIGTQGGLNLYNRKSDNIIPVASTIPHSIEDISEDKQGNLLIAAPEGLFVLNRNDLSLKAIIGGVYVTCILNNKDGKLWVGTYNGLYLVDAVNLSYKPIKSSLSGVIIRSICQDSKGRIWMGTNYAGLVLMEFKEDDPEKPVFKSFNHKNNNSSSISQGSILSIIDDYDGNLWIGIENGGLDLLSLDGLISDDPKFRHYTNISTDNTSISNNSIHSLFKDNQNTVWIGTYGGGINYYNKLFQKFKTIRPIPNNRNSISNSHVNALFSDKDYLWVGTEGGLDVLDNKNNIYRHFIHENNNPNSLGANAVWAIFRDSRKNMWIGTWAGGLDLLNEKTYTFDHYTFKIDNENSIGGNNIFRITEDDNELWIASMSGGVNKFNFPKGIFTRLLHDEKKNSLSNNWVGDIMVNGKNEIWIATSTSVDIYNKKTGKFKSFKHNQLDGRSISYNGALGFFKDSKNHIWICTEDGLNLFHRNDSTFSYYRVEDGLPNNTINAICEDNHGNLWLSTNKGISKFINGINLPRKPEFRNYDVSDGLQGNEFIRLSSCKDEKGNIYFGGTNGFNVFHPDSLKDNPTKPVVVFTDFMVFNKPVKIGAKGSPLKQSITLTNEISLTHNLSVFSIKFSALNYIAPEKNQYAFILEGFEKDWNYVGSQRTATYTNLDPGKYIFKVKACNNDGIWNNNYASVIIHILPPWWLTWWAKLIYGLFVFAGLYFFRKYSIISVNVKNQLVIEHIEKQKLEELNKMKIRFFTNISHELRTPLTLIFAPLESLLNSSSSKHDIKNQLALIYRNAERLFKLVNDLMDFTKTEDSKLNLKVQPGNIIKFTKEISGFFLETATRQQIEYQFSSENDNIEAWFDRDKLEKIILNLLSNAFKFTPFKGKIFVTVKKSILEQRSDLEEKQNGVQEFVCISVIDNGPGIAPEYLDKIFERFYQIPDNKLNNHAGTGIGLALTKTLVELHQGFISVKSEPWIETNFSVFLPLGKSHVQPSEIIDTPVDIKEVEEQKSITSSRRKAKEKNDEPIILIVEDNFELREYVTSRLRENYRIIEAENGKVGFEKALLQVPDLIISDILMPEMSGTELCKRVREEISISHIPIILLTAKAGIEDKIEGVETGADAYITKPFNIQYVEVVIRKLIESRRNLYRRFSQEVYIMPKEITNSSIDQDFLERVINYIHENINNSELSVEDIAQHIPMSYSTASRKIKALTGQSINEFIRTVRLKMAVKLMENEKLNISEIAYSVGFSTPAYFTMCFREQFGKPPSSFIDKKQRKNNCPGSTIRN